MVVVKGISQPVFLGSDFFHNHGCRIAYDTGTFQVQDTEVPIHFQKSPPGVCRVFLEEKLTCEPGAEVITIVKLENGYGKNDGSPGVIECKKQFDINTQICLARCVSIPRDGFATVRLANFSDNSVTLKACKSLSHFYPLNRDFGSINYFSMDMQPENIEDATPEGDSELN